jgi:hypothetical protein
VTVEGAYLLLGVSPLQCLTSPILVRSPFPSHPPVRSDFPNTAVRQASPSLRHRVRPVLQRAAADIGQAPRLQLAVRIAVPSDSPAFTSVGQVATKANGDEVLESPACLARVRVTEGVHPSRQQRIDLGHEFLRTERRAARGEVLQFVTDRLLGRLRRKERTGRLARRGPVAFAELHAAEVQALG